eukprot:CAMPEP_0168195262 /NCGR_PEP_ID=MMETSP0139_2-20121125/19741_1 /TAXON_ID=44445 /ORGANISM="Pseudo-nitzschia australis, Strain 10249 10 AB" /LENGTH=125 /DNA_ID=CAMNT_0008119063 /DNA_START=403 /DNA_END=780 /DNA_ORIENTATION=-
MAYKRVPIGSRLYSSAITKEARVVKKANNCDLRRSDTTSFFAADRCCSSSCCCRSQKGAIGSAPIIPTRGGSKFVIRRNRMEGGSCALSDPGRRFWMGTGLLDPSRAPLSAADLVMVSVEVIPFR